jgi:hypothetical protein
MSTSGNITASLPTAYKFDPAGYPAFRKTLVIRLSILMPVLLVGFMCLLWHFEGPRSFVLLVLIPVLTCWIAYHQVKEQQRNWESLEFDFRDGKLVRRLDKYPPLEFMPDEVTEIVEYPKGIAVKTINRQRTMSISNGLSDFASFRQQLEAWAPDAPVTKWAASPRDYVRVACELLACAWVFGGPLYLMFTRQQKLILPVGLALTFSMLGMILYVRKSPHLPTRARIGMWFLLLLPILGMVYRLGWIH